MIGKQKELFQSTPPARGATAFVLAGASGLYVFQSTPPARGATFAVIIGIVRSLLNFNPRPPRGGRPMISPRRSASSLFQSTPPARGATCRHQRRTACRRISIHAPREGGDAALCGWHDAACISIHAPREGGDQEAINSQSQLDQFQSTPPARGATCRCRPCRGRFCISIHAPREGGDGGGLQTGDVQHQISIHAPREGGDVGQLGFVRLKGISIHAPREGGDAKSAMSCARTVHFNPRPPRGGRLRNADERHQGARISIHAPREGGDRAMLCAILQCTISIHAPREGGDLRLLRLLMAGGISIHAPREGGDVEQITILLPQILFQSTPPARGATCRSY